MTGSGLEKMKDDPQRLYSVAEGRYGGVYARWEGRLQENGIPFAIVPERWHHRLWKAIGVAHEVQVNDREFDRRYFIMTDFPHHLDALLQQGKFLKDVKELMLLPVKSIYASGSRIWCEIAKPDVEKNSDYFVTHQRILQTLSEDLKLQPAQGRTVVSRQRRWWVLACICLHSCVMAYGTLGVIPTLFDDYDTLYYSHMTVAVLVPALALAGLWLVFLFMMFMGTSWLGWVVADFMLWGFVGVWLAGIVAAREVNIYGPQLQPVPVVRQVVGRSCELVCTRGKGSRTFKLNAETDCNVAVRNQVKDRHASQYSKCASSHFNYDIALQPLSPNERLFTFKGDSYQFDSARVGHTMTVEVWPGALGFEWVDITRIKPQFKPVQRVSDFQPLDQVR